MRLAFTRIIELYIRSPLTIIHRIAILSQSTIVNCISLILQETAWLIFHWIKSNALILTESILAIFFQKYNGASVTWTFKGRENFFELAMVSNYRGRFLQSVITLTSESCIIHFSPSIAAFLAYIHCVRSIRLQCQSKYFLPWTLRSVNKSILALISQCTIR